MTTSKIEKLKSEINDFYAGSLSSRELIGTGWKYPRGVAAGYLQKELYNLENPGSPVSGVQMKADGFAYISKLHAERSIAHKKLLAGEFKLINDAEVKNFGIMPACGGLQGFVIYYTY